MAAKSEGSEVTPDIESKRLQLKLVGKAASGHRRALWAETKHYTWWLLAIVGGLLYAGTKTGTDFYVRAGVILVGCLGGLIIALIALRVVRRETEAANDNMRVYDRLVKELGLEEPGHAVSDARASKGMGALIGAMLGRKSAKSDTADCFQFSLCLAAVVYALAFIGVLIYAILR